MHRQNTLVETAGVGYSRVGKLHSRSQTPSNNVLHFWAGRSWWPTNNIFQTLVCQRVEGQMQR